MITIDLTIKELSNSKDNILVELTLKKLSKEFDIEYVTLKEKLETFKKEEKNVPNKIEHINNIKIKNKRLFNFRSVMDKLNENSEFPFRTKIHHMARWWNW